MAGKTERFEMRIDEETMQGVDTWRAAQDDLPSRAEAIRRLIDVGLVKDSKATVKFTDGEKLLTMMLADIYEHLKIKDGDIDAGYIKEVIHGGHTWAPKWDMQGLFHDHIDNPANVTFVVNVLDMWTFIEEGYAKLSAADKKRVEVEVGPLGENPKFHGFDGNNEAEFVNIARFLVEQMNRFSSFKGRSLNSHSPSLSRHQRMSDLFEVMRPRLGMRSGLGADSIIELLNADR